LTPAFETAWKLSENNPLVRESLRAGRADQVRAFHRFYGQPEDTGLENMTPERVAMRLGLIIEEVRELLLDGFGVGTEIYYKDPKETDEGWTNCGYYADLTDAVICSQEDGTFNIVEAVDALADISYVVDGFAIELGVDLDAVIDEVHASNMTKPDENGQPIYRSDGKVLKGPYYTKPDIASVIFKKD
jgi:predicted HAD superfamily Cof-like phosphohydrolase